MKNWLKIILWAAMLFASQILQAQDNQDLSKYQQAKIEINYNGELGYFAQLLAYKLNVAYYAEVLDPKMKLSVQQTAVENLADLFEKVNQQLPQHHLILTQLNNQPTLALVSKQIQHLQQAKFIGEVIFAEPKPVMQEAAATDNPQTKAQMLEQQKKMDEIVKVSQDSELQAKYPRRSAPIYNLQDQQATGLETVRSTKLSTFLVFKQGLDVSQYRVEGEYQDIAKVGNIIGLLHRQKPAPKLLKIINEQNQLSLVERNN